MDRPTSEILSDHFAELLSDFVGLLILVIAGLIVYRAVRSFLRRKGDTARSFDAERSHRSAADDPLFIPDPVLLHAIKPNDDACFKAVRDFATEKQVSGHALLAEEQFAMGPVALGLQLAGDDGLAHMDSFGEHPPYKGWELRQAMDRIGATEFGDLFERAMAIYLHRFQLIRDMTGTGMPMEQALSHPDMPQYDDLDMLVQRAGGLAALQVLADQYFRDNYPWAPA